METAEIQYPQGLKQEVGLETESRIALPPIMDWKPAELPYPQRFTSRSRKPPISLFRRACLCLRALYVSLHPFLLVEVVRVVCPSKQPPQDLGPQALAEANPANSAKQPLRKGSAEAI